MGAKYHADALITYALVEIYNKIFERSFYGYSKDDRQNIRFYLTILINFESSKTEIIYRFLRQNSEHSRIVDLFGVIKDYISLQYYDEVSNILKRLMIANNDRYIIMESGISISFIDKYGIVERSQPILKLAKEFKSTDDPLIIYNTINYQLPPLNVSRIVTHQMMQDRLPLDINRNIYITLEGVITAILYPIIKLYFDRKSDIPIDFKIYFIDSSYLKENSDIYRINLKLYGDSLDICLTEINTDEMIIFNNEQNIELQLKNHIINIGISNSETLICINTIEFSDMYPDVSNYVNNVLELESASSPKPIVIIDHHK